MKGHATGAGGTRALPVPDADFYRVTEVLSPAELEKSSAVRAFANGKVRPVEQIVKEENEVLLGLLRLRNQHA